MAQQQHKIVVIGASGYVGRNLQRYVAASSTQPSSTQIQPSSTQIQPSSTQIQPSSTQIQPSSTQNPPVTSRLVTLSRAQFHALTEEAALWPVRRMDYDSAPTGHVQASIQGAVALINLAGAGRQSADNPYEKSIVETARRAVLLCKKANIPRIVHMSGLGASPDTPIAYLSAKYRAESVICDSGLNYVILRPSYIVGGGDHLAAYIKDRCADNDNNNNEEEGRSTVVEIPGSREDSSPIQPICIEDAVRIIMWGATAPAIQNHILDLVGPDRIPFYEYVSRLAKAAGADAVPVTMEAMYRRALEVPSSSAAFGVDDLGIIMGGFVGDYDALCDTTGVHPKPVLPALLDAGSLS